MSETERERRLTDAERGILDRALRRSLRPVDGVRQVTLTLDQLRELIVSYWFAEPPASIADAELLAEQVTLGYWHRQREGSTP